MDKHGQTRIIPLRANHDLDSGFKQLQKQVVELQAQVNGAQRQIAGLEKSKAAGDKAKEQMGACRRIRWRIIIVAPKICRLAHPATSKSDDICRFKFLADLRSQRSGKTPLYHWPAQEPEVVSTRLY